jgi:hypothetical protein
MREKINMYRVLVGGGGAEGNDYLEDLGVDGNIITKESPKTWTFLIHIPSSRGIKV